MDTFQAKMLWHDGSIGWKPKVAYRWLLHHRPDIGAMRFYLYQGTKQVMDSGNIYDSTLKGGRLGLYCFSQEEIIWSNMEYKCASKLDCPSKYLGALVKLVIKIALYVGLGYNSSLLD